MAAFHTVNKSCHVSEEILCFPKKISCVSKDFLFPKGNKSCLERHIVSQRKLSVATNDHSSFSVLIFQERMRSKERYPIEDLKQPAWDTSKIGSRGLHVATLDGNNWLKLFVLKVKNDHLHVQLSSTTTIHIWIISHILHITLRFERLTLKSWH